MKPTIVLNPLRESRMLFAGLALIFAGIALLAMGRDDTGSIILSAGIVLAGVRATLPVQEVSKNEATTK